MTEPLDRLTLVENTAEIIAAYVSNNALSTTDLASLIGSVGHKLTELSNESARNAATGPEPAVPINRSVRKNHLVCLLCGQSQKLLKRHLASSHDLTPEDYRAQFSLKPNYPMVASGYAEQRREMAKRMGLGRPKAKKPAKTPAKPRSKRAKT